MGRGKTLSLSRAETTVPINTKFWKNNNVDQMKTIAKFCENLFHGCSSLCGWNVQLQILALKKVSSAYLFLIFDLSNNLHTVIRNGFWRVMAQKTWFDVRMCLLGVRSVTIGYNYGFKIPQNCSSTEIQAKTRTYKNAEQLCTHAICNSCCHKLLTGNRVCFFWINIFFFIKTPCCGEILHLLPQSTGIDR